MNSAEFSKMKVFHFISGDLWAGAEAMTFNLLGNLKKYPDLDLAVILFNEGRLAGELRGIGLPVHVIDEKQYSFREIIQRTRALLHNSPPDLIHSHRYKENILAVLAAGFSGKIKLIATQHGLPELPDEKASLASRVVSTANFHLLSKRFTRIVAVSADIRNVLINRHAFDEHSVESIHNGIEIPGGTVPKQKDGTFVIGSSGRLFPVKDYPLMVEVARVVASARVQDVQFELAGEGFERPVLEAMIQKYGLHDRFVLKGHQEDMDTFYRGMDIYLNTSIHEGIPMTILEALARGIPVVAPAVGGICEIITNGVEGFLIESRNPDAFAEKCLLLRDNRELREKMADAARIRAERAFSAENMGGNYYRLYRRTVPRSIPWN